LTAVARRLRTEHRFCGYIHLKGVPGASRELLLEAGSYADRLSVNIEMSSQHDLDRLAPAKRHAEIENSMAQIQEGALVAGDDRKSTPGQPKFTPAGQTTQMVIGATAASDSEILAKASELYKTHSLRRVYYSAFSPIPDSDSELPVKPPPLVREHRLYQADWLMRFYGFAASELTTEGQHDLALNADPKLVWALRNRDFFPVDVNAASREALLRVPGFGVRAVDRILRIRRYHRIASADLVKLRIPMRRSQPFIVAADIRARHLDDAALADRVIARPEQLPLFTDAAMVHPGEL
jgi:predicted DNA-binding helix-hairpin-helix protein